MSLPSHYDLGGRLRIREDPRKPVTIVEQKRRTFVCREPPRESQRKRVGIQNGPSLLQLQRRGAVPRALSHGPVARVVNQRCPAFGAHLPNLHVTRSLATVR